MVSFAVQTTLAHALECGIKRVAIQDTVTGNWEPATVKHVGLTRDRIFVQTLTEDCMMLASLPCLA